MNSWADTITTPDAPTTPPEPPAGGCHDDCDECRLPLARCPGPGEEATAEDQGRFIEQVSEWVRQSCYHAPPQPPYVTIAGLRKYL